MAPPLTRRTPAERRHPRSQREPCTSLTASASPPESSRSASAPIVPGPPGPAPASAPPPRPPPGPRPCPPPPGPRPVPAARARSAARSGPGPKPRPAPGGGPPVPLLSSRSPVAESTVTRNPVRARHFVKRCLGQPPSGVAQSRPQRLSTGAGQPLLQRRNPAPLAHTQKEGEHMAIADYREH